MMNCKKKIIVVCLAFCLGITAQASTLNGSLLAPERIPNSWKLPDNVIDTEQLPHFSLENEASDDKPFPVYQLTNNTYFLFGNIDTLDKQNRGWNGNAGFVVTDKGVVVIDALGTPRLGRRLIATIRSITDIPIKYLVVTHNHPDHAYGAAAFQNLKGVTIIGHKGTVDYNHSATFEESVAYRRELLPEDMRGFEPLKPDIYIDEPEFGKYSFELGGHRFDIYNTGRHHSYGDLIVYQPTQEIVWISDLAFNQRTTFMGDGDSQQILQAQNWLRDNFSHVRLMVPGHGGPQTRPFPMIDKTHDYVQRMRREMKRAVNQGVTLYDAVQQSEFEEWRNTRLYDENHPANANFVYREMEKAYFEGFQ